MKRQAVILTIGLGVGALATGAITAFGHSGASADAIGVDAPRASDATIAVHALIAMPAEQALTYVPSGFPDDRGYVPTVRDGTLLDPDGDCSSPVPLPADFDIACKQHDLGYDLLRFGVDSGDPAAAHVRRDLDARLGETMHRACDSRPSPAARIGCTVAADIALSAVHINSWRQHYGAPHPEPALPFVLALVGAGIAVAVAGAGAGAASMNAVASARRESIS